MNLGTACVIICVPIFISNTGVSCDSCLKGNFRGRRYKCLICYDYDLCANCYENGATTTRHTAEHPMQCILTRSDFGKYQLSFLKYQSRRDKNILYISWDTNFKLAKFPRDFIVFLCKKTLQMLNFPVIPTEVHPKFPSFPTVGLRYQYHRIIRLILGHHNKNSGHLKQAANEIMS